MYCNLGLTCRETLPLMGYAVKRCFLKFTNLERPIKKELFTNAKNLKARHKWYLRIITLNLKSGSCFPSQKIKTTFHEIVSYNSH